VLPLYYTLTQRILSTSTTRHSPFFPPSLLPPPICLPSRLFLDIRFYFLLSFLSFPLYLSICLSVCPSLATSHAHSHDQSTTQMRITPIHLVHSLAHSPALTHTLIGFLFLFHTRWLYVCNNMDLQNRTFIAASSFSLFSRKARAKVDERKKKVNIRFK